MSEKNVLSISGGKDSTAMLLTLALSIIQELELRVNRKEKLRAVN